MIPQLAEFSSPSIEYSLLSPMLIVFGVAIAGVLVEAFVPRQQRWLVQVGLALVAIVVAGVIQVGPLAAMTRSSFLSCRTQLNMPSRYLGVSMPCSWYSGMMTSQSEWVLKGYFCESCLRRILWL